jgi:hydroxymethylpyrimidine/phosphomethylpyrimidine kinase
MCATNISAARWPCALTIAGSDSGAGAGIQADLKTFCAHGVYGLTALTMVTVQNTQSVKAVHLLPRELIEAQIEALWADFEIGAVKTGALGCEQTIQLVAMVLRRQAPAQLVVDPVMISKHGHTLLPLDAIAALKSDLLPCATLVTPNLSEAAVLANTGRIEDRAGMLQAARIIADLGSAGVIVKGGHMAGDPVDLLWYRDQAYWLEGGRIDTVHTHGTGCTYSAAITANLVRGMDVVAAVQAAKDFIHGSLQHVQQFGRGINPVNHFWRIMPGFGTWDKL